MGGRVKDRGESKSLIVMIRIVVESIYIRQHHGTGNRADFRVVFQHETL
jgi:hypothetical protein